jgi:hypothetical protein
VRPPACRPAAVGAALPAPLAPPTHRRRRRCPPPAPAAGTCRYRSDPDWKTGKLPADVYAASDAILDAYPKKDEPKAITVSAPATAPILRPQWAKFVGLFFNRDGLASANADTMAVRRGAGVLWGALLGPAAPAKRWVNTGFDPPLIRMPGLQPRVRPAPHIVTHTHPSAQTPPLPSNLSLTLRSATTTARRPRRASRSPTVCSPA